MPVESDSMINEMYRHTVLPVYSKHYHNASPVKQKFPVPVISEVIQNNTILKAMNFSSVSGLVETAMH